MTEDYRVTPQPGPAHADTPSAKDKASDAAAAGKQAAGEVAATATDAAKNVAQETTTQAKDVLGKARDQASEQAGVQQQSLVDNLRSLVDQLTGMTDNAEQDGVAVELATKARDQARDAADWLDGREPSEVLDGLRDLGRRRPGAFLAGALVAGVAAGRLTRGVQAVHTDGAGKSADAGSATPSPSPSPSGSGKHEHSGPTGYASATGDFSAGDSSAGSPQPGYQPHPGTTP